MAQVIIARELKGEALRRFGGEAKKIFDLMESLEKHPQRGKALGSVAGIVLKELKYKKFRLYFITDGHVLKFGSPEQLAALLIKFARMSEKKNQQRVIAEVKRVLRSLGFEKL